MQSPHERRMGVKLTCGPAAAASRRRRRRRVSDPGQRQQPRQPRHPRCEPCDRRREFVGLGHAVRFRDADRRTLVSSVSVYAGISIFRTKRCPTSTCDQEERAGAGEGRRGRAGRKRR